MPLAKRFNTAGPCDPSRHYMLPAAERLPEALRLIDDQGYFVLHAPRQTGKTTTLRAIAKALTASGRYAALHFSCETAEPAQDDYGAAERAVLSTIRSAADLDLPADLAPPPWPDGAAATRLHDGLRAWSRACPRPLVLLFDEIDALRGESLRSVLRQLRAGFPERPGAFPHAVVLCGLRDVRDYRVASGGDPERLGTSSPFNVKVASLRLGDFTGPDVRALLLQHTLATGQPFEEAALARAFERARGQPWLTNALAREVVEEMRVPLDEPITAAHIDEAKERLILARATHLDSLAARLTEPRVRRILEPILAGGLVPTDAVFDDDFLYVRDLGLIGPELPPRPANPIYREVIVRTLAGGAERNVLAEPRSFVRKDGRLDMPRLLAEFLGFWRQHGETLAAGVSYGEIGPQLVLMAFLQRIVNGGGTVEREVGVGRGRIDVHIRWPYEGEGGARLWQVEALELKARGPKDGDPLDEGLEQLDAYLDALGLETGVLAIFDRRPDAPHIRERSRLEAAATPRGRTVTVLRG